MPIQQILRNFAADFALMGNTIELDKLEIGTHTFEFQLDDNYFHAVEKTEVLSGNINAKAVLNLRQADYDLTMQVNGVVQVTCDRCLDPMDIEVGEEEPVETDETERILDLDWLAYEMIIVHLPLVHSHQDGGCNPEMAALLQNHLCTDDGEENNVG